MAKNSYIIIFELVIIFFWLFFFGQLNGTGAIIGDINMIDEGQYAAWINRMHNSEVMYRDFYLQYGPLLVIPSYLFSLFVGENMFALRLGTYFAGTFLGIAVAIILMRRLVVHPFVQGVTTIFILAIPGVHIRQWAGIFCLLLFSEILSRKSTFLAYILGVVIILTFLISVEVGVFALLLIVGASIALLFTTRQKKQLLALLRAVFVGFILSFLSFFVYSYVSGWFWSYVLTTQDVLSSLSGIQLPNGTGLPNVFAGRQLRFEPLTLLQFIFSREMLFYWSLLLTLLFLVLTIIRFFLKKTTVNDRLILLIIVFTLFSYASIVGRSGHYFSLVGIVFVILSYFLSLGITHFKRFKNKNFFTVLVISLFFIYGMRHVIVFRYADFFDLRRFYTFISSVPSVSPLFIPQNQARDILLLQHFVRQNTSKDDMIYVFNNLPALYFLLDRQNATDFDLPLLAGTREKRSAIVESLQENKPKYIIEYRYAWAVDGVSDRQRMPEVIAYILTNYKIIHNINGYVFYEEK